MVTRALMVAIAFALARPSLAQTVVHVAPDGDDDARGTDRESSLRTLEAARARIRGAAGRHRYSQPDGRAEVILHAGEYRLESTFVIEPEDAGSILYPVAYRAAPGERVVITGAADLGPWQPGERAGVPVWSAEIPVELRSSPGQPPGVRSLWINDARRARARTPNTGYLRVQDVPDVPEGTAWHQGQSHFRFKEADRSAWESVRPGAEVVGFTRWVDTHLVVLAVDPETRRARFTRPAMFLLSPDDWYFIEGTPAQLDAPGEWSLDESGTRVLYVPMPGETPGSARARVPRLTELVRIAGRPGTGGDKGATVEHISFEGITFAHARWWFAPDFKATWPSPEVQGFPQAAVGVPGAIRAEGARHVMFDRCTFEHLDGYALELSRGCAGNVVRGCRFTDLGAGAIKIGETAIRSAKDELTWSNTVSDCIISGGGYIHDQAVGIWIGQSESNTIEHNLIENLHYTGISIGWTWGYGPSLAGGNVIEFNEVRNIGKRAGEAEAPLGDMAAIYTLGTQAGTIIRNNYFHDIAGRSIAWGIYFDEGSTGIVAMNNLVASTTHGGFHQHYGKDNTVSNNVFLDGRDAQIWKTRREPHHAFTFSRNIVVWSGEAFMAGDWGGTDFTLESNVYWRREGKPVAFPGGLDLAAWQKSGRDAQTVIADPGIDRGAKALLEGSPAARAAGFVPVDLRGVGPRETGR